MYSLRCFVICLCLPSLMIVVDRAVSLPVRTLQNFRLVSGAVGVFRLLMLLQGRQGSINWTIEVHVLIYNRSESWLRERSAVCCIATLCNGLISSLCTAILQNCIAYFRVLEKKRFFEIESERKEEWETHFSCVLSMGLRRGSTFVPENTTLCLVHPVLHCFLPFSLFIPIVRLRIMRFIPLALLPTVHSSFQSFLCAYCVPFHSPCNA